MFDEKSYSLKMDKAIEVFSKELSSLRTGRANASMLDLIKVDVEAYEYEVLKGSKTHLERGTPFYVEIHDKWLREIGLSRFDIIELFKEYGYTEQFLWRPEHQINWADLYYYVFTKK